MKISELLRATIYEAKSTLDVSATKSENIWDVKYRNTMIGKLKKNMNGKWAVMQDANVIVKDKDSKDEALAAFEKHLAMKGAKGLSEGVFVVKSSDGVEKRFKDANSPEAKAWKTTVAKKPNVKLAVYSDAYWAKKEDESDDFDFVSPSKPIKGDYAATDKINKVVEDQFNTDKIDWTLGRAGEMKRDGTTCATIVVRVSYEYGPEDDMGFDDVRGDTQNILIARNPKKPSQLDFVQFA